MAHGIPFENPHGFEYEVSRFYMEGEWHEVTPDTDPKSVPWMQVEVVTINYDPGGEGNYRNFKVFMGLDPYPADAGGYDIDDLAYEGALEYGFVPE